MPQKTNITLATYPELVKEWHPTKNLEKKPKDYAQFSNKEVWWKCDLGPDHEWEDAVYKRTKQRQSCPYCTNRRLSVTNRFDLNQTLLMTEWNYQKNTIKPSEITEGTNKKVWWLCKEGHEWESKVADRVQRGYGCKLCNNKRAGRGGYYKTGEWTEQRLDLIEQWVYEKNDMYGQPSDFSGGSSKKVWWKCNLGPDHEWEAEIRKRVQTNTNCPFCAGKKISVTNSLVKNYPDIAKQFHPTLNGKLKVESLFMNSNKTVWWKCLKGPDHEWKTKVYSRTYRNRDCPFCSGHNVSVTNNLEINAPKIAKQFDLEKNYPKLPSDFSTGSNESVWWKCDNPEHRGWQAPIAARMRQSIGCYICNQEERFANESRLFDIVKDLYPEHKVQRAIRPKWLDGLEIDIFVPSLNLAIEYQGRQHYEAIEFFGGEKGFKKRQILDEKKRVLLKENNINLLEWKYTVEMTKQRVRKEINKII